MSIEALAAIITCGFSVSGVIFMAGTSHGRLRDQAVRLDKHDGTLTEHNARISDIELEQAETKGWKRGFETGLKNKGL